MNKQLQLRNEDEVLAVCGSLDSNIQLLEDKLPVTVIPRGQTLILEGKEEGVLKTVKILDDYLEILRENGEAAEFSDFLDAWFEDAEKSSQMARDVIMKTRDGQPVYPRTVAQEHFVEAIRNHSVVFAIGPAGTGKTYLSMAMALTYLQQNRFSRIVLARPAVEAGENLGFLPGDLQEKVNPYLRPLYDAIYNLMDFETCNELLEEGIIEVVPLAFMRGRTLADSFVILDEAQNTTRAQMKMFLTRLGVNSCSVINGDITQIDLPEAVESGLVHARRVLDGVKGVSFVEFSRRDVIRHDIVKNIIDAYEKEGNR